MGIKWMLYKQTLKQEFLKGTAVKPIGKFKDGELIALVEAGAECYHPLREWNCREWLESIHCVLNHGCCNGCKARSQCESLSKGG